LQMEKSVTKLDLKFSDRVRIIGMGSEYDGLEVKVVGVASRHVIDVYIVEFFEDETRVLPGFGEFSAFTVPETNLEKVQSEATLKTADEILQEIKNSQFFNEVRGKRIRLKYEDFGVSGAAYFVPMELAEDKQTMVGPMYEKTGKLLLQEDYWYMGGLFAEWRFY
jgi:hypothetical protein